MSSARTPGTPFPGSSPSGTSSACLDPGTRIGPYVLDELLGRGGMGAVYRAHHTRSGAIHALKVMSLVADSDTSKALARFQREMEVLGQFESHPAVVKVFASGTDAGLPWCAMEYVSGGSLATRLEGGPLPPREAATLVAEVARALDHVHRHGVVHRDLKPENVLIDERGRPRVVDFGLAYDVLSERLTKTGELLGTPSYMAPEQISRKSDTESADGSAVERVTDVYGLGALLYAALTAKPPFEGKDPLGLVVDVMRKLPTPPRKINQDVPPGLQEICLRALEKEPEHRYRTAADFARELEHYLDGASVEAARLGDRLGRAVRHRLPGTTAGRVAAVLGVIAGAVAVAAGVSLSVGGERRPPRERVAELEAAIERRGRLSVDEHEALAELRESARPEDDEALRSRVELLAILATDAIDAEDPRARLEAARRIAELARPHGSIDLPLLRRAERVLAKNARWAALHAVLGASPPRAPVSRDWAPDLARAIVASWAETGTGPTLEIPDDEEAFAALYRAPGVDDATRGRLLIRRGRRALEGDDPDFDRALEAFVAALAEHHILVDRPHELPTSLRERGLAELLRRVQQGEEAWALSELVAAMAERDDDLPLDFVKDLMTEAHAALGIYDTKLGDAKKRDLERAFVAGTFFQRFAQSPSSPSDLTLFVRGIGIDAVLERANEEMALPPERRSVGALVLVARMLAFGSARLTDADARRAKRWLRATEARKVDAPWYHLHCALVLDRLGDTREAIVRLERGLELDRERALDRRWMAIPCELAKLLLDAERAAPDLFDPDRLIDLVEETTRVASASAERVRRIVGGGGIAPWKLDRPISHAQVVRRAVGLIRARGKACCAGAVRPDDLLDPAIPLTGDADERLEALRAAHHLDHGRTVEALDDLTRAIAHQQDLANRLGDFARTRQRRLNHLASLFEERARLHERLGDTDAAKRDVREAARSKKRARQIAGS